MAEKPEGTCAFCCGRATTRDHIPNRKFFPPPRPSDLITVPSCAACNNDASPDEEYFLNVLLAHWRAETPSALATRRDRFAKRTDRRVRMSKRMLDNVRFDEWVTAAGIHLGKGYILKIDFSRLERIFDKIVRGLYWEHYGERLPADRATFTRFDDTRELVKLPLVQHVMKEGQGRQIGGGTFDYRILRADDGSHTGQVVMLFWDAVVALSTFVRTADVERLQRGERLAEADDDDDRS